MFRLAVLAAASAVAAPSSGAASAVASSASGAASALVASASGPAGLEKLGVYDFDVQESSPVVFNGALLMVESMLPMDPEWARLDPALANCSGYFRVRDQRSGVVLVNISQTCGLAFAAATVATNDGGLDTLYIFGTEWNRVGSPWKGPCSQGSTCVIDAFATADPALQEWSAARPLLAPGGVVYNVDVARVGEAAGGAMAGAQWVMQTEGSAPTFFVCNGSDPTRPACWAPLPPATYGLDAFPGRQIGPCPSLRYDGRAGWWYVMTGGGSISVLRSPTLQRGSWTLGGTLLAPDSGDCAIAPAPFGGWYSPSAEAAAHIAACQAGDKGFGDVSDVDVTEVVVANGSVATLFQYGPGDQRTFGFSALAIAYQPLFAFLAAMF